MISRYSSRRESLSDSLLNKKLKDAKSYDRKAGVITLENGEKTSFLGSANESFSGWKLNCEFIWEDSSKEAIEWVQEEFDLLWNDNQLYH